MHYSRGEANFLAERKKQLMDLWRTRENQALEIQNRDEEVYCYVY